MEKKNKKKKIIILLVVGLFMIGGVAVFLVYQKYFSSPPKTSTKSSTIKEVYSKYRMDGNGLEDFDLSFLQLENKMENMIYSPLSIKYALAMLREGAEGKSKEQIESVIGEYKNKKYPNNTNMSFANAMFIRNTYKDQIRKEYISNLTNKYNAEVIYDDFANTNNLNSWVSNKTFGLINDLFDDVSANQYILVNALAINMDWNRTIQAEATAKKLYFINYYHENYSANIYPIMEDNYESIKFNNNSDVKSAEIGASINNYDIIKELGEENIRNTISAKYEEYLQDENSCKTGDEPDVETYLNKYMSELNSNYKRINTSTDFSFYNDDDVKVFSKDLKKYDDTTLQYVAIMPKKEELTNYIDKINATKVSNLISKVKTIELHNFEYGKVYQITGKIPLFKFDYKLDLISDLQKLGIKDIFDEKKADLSNLTKEKEGYIDSVTHKANIEFSNQGIKAAAATEGGGFGSTSCGFEYKYDVPIEIIDLTFDQPYMFLIRDKTTGEVWFSGKVYQPTIN